MQQYLLVTVRHHFGYPLHVLLAGLHQASQALFRTENVICQAYSQLSIFCNSAQ